MRAKWAGRCACGNNYPAGSEITYDRATRTTVACPGCSEASESPVYLDLEVRCKGIRYSKPDGSWTILNCSLTSNGAAEAARTGAPITSGEVTVVGPIGLEFGREDILIARGEWTRDPKYGWQFSAVHASRSVGSSVETLYAYLQRLDGVGPKRAARILQHFDQDFAATIAALDEGEHTLAKVPGLGEKLARTIVASYQRDVLYRATFLWLVEVGVDPQTGRRILEKWGAEAKDVLTRNPYELLEVLKGERGAFDFVDGLAIKSFGLHPHDLRRAEAVVCHWLEQEENDGHTWANLVTMTDLRALPEYNVAELFPEGLPAEKTVNVLDDVDDYSDNSDLDADDEKSV